jgi:hypothetical protein
VDASVTGNPAILASKMREYTNQPRELSFQSNSPLTTGSSADNAAHPSVKRLQSVRTWT